MPEKLRTGIAMVAPRTFWTGQPMALTPEERAAKKAAPPYDLRDGVAVIRIRGVIQKTPPDWSTYSTGTINTGNAILQAAADPKVKGILLSVDSPGGYADGILELGDAIYQARALKPVIAQVDGMAASAAYWAASQASTLYLGAMDMVGSIGVYSLVLDDSKWAADMGYKVYLVSSGGIKGAGEVGQEIGKEYLAEAEKVVMTINGFFLDAVARGRRMDRTQVEKLNDGRIHIGAEAVKLGLADGVQNFTQTFDGLRSALRGAQARDRVMEQRLSLDRAQMELTARLLKAKSPQTHEETDQ